MFLMGGFGPLCIRTNDLEKCLAQHFDVRDVPVMVSPFDR